MDGRPKRIKKFAFTIVCVYNRLPVDGASGKRPFYCVMERGRNLCANLPNKGVEGNTMFVKEACSDKTEVSLFILIIINIL